jgi:hypothetical protein
VEQYDMRDASQIAQLVIDVQGYLVVWSSKPLTVGKPMQEIDNIACDMTPLAGPIMVLGTATEEDFNNQVLSFFPEDKDLPAPKSEYPDCTYYKVGAE